MQNTVTGLQRAYATCRNRRHASAVNRCISLALGIIHSQTVSLRIIGPDRTFWAMAEISYHQLVYWLEESWIEPQVDRTVTQ